MGGLLCKAMIRQLLLDRDQNSISRIGGLILMATPQLGSLRTPRWIVPFSLDARALAAHGKLVKEINDAFENEVALDEETNTFRKTTIPTWAVEGVYDHWVDPLSAGMGLPYSRRLVVRGSHTSIVKPADKKSDVYKWVADKISKSLNRFTYDVFIAAVMAGHGTDEKYAADRAVVEELKRVLVEECEFASVFYAGTTIDSIIDFDPKALALRDDLEAMRRSRNFLLYYPEPVASSVLYEAGWALILGKPSVYLVKDDKDLPFLLNDARQAFSDGRVKILESPDTPAMLKEVARWGNQLFEFKRAEG
jgi:hypothetical protein